MKTFSKYWKASRKPKKQRKYQYNAPLHIRNKLVSSRLSKELAKKYGARNITLKKGDKVKIMRGQFSGKTGKVSRVDLKKASIFIEGIEQMKIDTYSPLLRTPGKWAESPSDETDVPG